MSLRDEVASWTAEAFHTLEVAQQISSSAHASLHSTATILTENIPSKIGDCVARYETVSKEHVSVESMTKNTRASVLAITDNHATKVGTILQPALRDLDAVLATLNGVEVPGFLVKRPGSDPSAVYHLDDFVASEEISMLKQNIGIYVENCEKVGSELRKQLSSVVSDAAAKSAQFKKITSIYEAQILPLKPLLKYGTSSPPSKNPSDLVGTIVRENNALGSELSSLLEMLTKHYDQCTLAAEWVRGSHKEAVDIDVLRSDTLELPAVLKEVRAIYDIITNNERRASAFSAQKLSHISMFTDLCAALSDAYTEFASTITQLLLLLVQSKTVFGRSSLDSETDVSETGPVEKYSSMVKDLCAHYRQFCAVYQAQYLSELHYEKYVYPRKFVKMLDDYLNGQLLILEDDERERRREWLRKYGEYIPGDFYLPGETDQPRVVQVVSDGLDHLESASAQDDEDRLVHLLRETRRGK